MKRNNTRRKKQTQPPTVVVTGEDPTEDFRTIVELNMMGIQRTGNFVLHALGGNDLWKKEKYIKHQVFYNERENRTEFKLQEGTEMGGLNLLYTCRTNTFWSNK